MHVTQFSKEIKNDLLSHIDDEVQLSNTSCHLTRKDIRFFCVLYKNESLIFHTNHNEFIDSQKNLIFIVGHEKKKDIHISMKFHQKSI
jgi:hypothetical protein